MTENEPPKRFQLSQQRVERADLRRDRNRPQPGKNKYRGNGSTRRPEERSWFSAKKK